jgi:phage terminase large subunit
MTQQRRKPNRMQRRYVYFWIGSGDGADAVRKAGYTRSEPKDTGSKLTAKPWVLIFALLLEERRRLRRRPVAAKAIRIMSDRIQAVLKKGRATSDERSELLRHQERLRNLPPASESVPTVPAPALPPLDLAPVFEKLRHPARYKGVHGGRGSGKSHAFAELLVRRCVEAAPLRAVCIREIQRSLDQSVKRLIEDKIQALGVGIAFRVQANLIIAGHEIWHVGADGLAGFSRARFGMLGPTVWQRSH